MKKLSGRVECADAQVVSGWAYSPDAPDDVVEVEIWDGERCLGKFQASNFREDLRAAGMGNGCHGFTCRFPKGLLGASRHVLSVRFAESGTELSASPALVEQDAGLDAAVVAHLLRLVDAERGSGRRTRSALLQAIAPVVNRILDMPSAAEDSEMLPDGRFERMVLAVKAQFPPIEFPVAKSPTLSIVVPARNCFPPLYRTLRSIADAEIACPYEVVIADDSSEDETFIARSIVGRGVRVARNEQAMGRTHALRAGVALSRGEVLMVVEPGFMLTGKAADEIVRSIVDGAAIAGAKIQGAEGRVIELDHELDRFGTPLPPLVGGVSGLPANTIVRDTTLVSTHCFGVSRKAWTRLGGLKAELGPIVYDLADMCLRARKAGLRVVANGLAPVVAPHDHEDDVRRRWGSALARRVFFEAWRNELPTVPVPRPVVVFLDDRLPRPNRDAGSSVVLSHMEAFRAKGHALVACSALDPEEADILALARAGTRVEDLGQLASSLPAGNRGIDFLYVHRFQNWLRPPVEQLAQVPRLLNVADLHFLRSQREAEVSGVEKDGMADACAQELAAIEAADAVIVHSEAERDMLLQRTKQRSIVVVPIVPTVQVASRPARDRAGIGFLGSGAHAPNIDAVSWIIGNLARELLERAPGVPIRIIGGGYPDALQVDPPANVVFTGPVSDLGEELQSLRMTIAPLRFGAGVKGKVIDSFASGTPSIMTPVAAEGIPLGDALSGLVADTTLDVGRLVLELYEDVERLDALVPLLHGHVAEHHSSDLLRQRLDEAVAAARRATRLQPAALSA